MTNMSLPTPAAVALPVSDNRSVKLVITLGNGLSLSITLDRME